MDRVPDTRPAADDEVRLAAALQRLERSRRRLRHDLMPPPHPAAGRDPGEPLSRRWFSWLRSGPLQPWVEMFEPWVASGSHAVQRWWRRHPWRGTAVLLADTGRETITPLVRRHPRSAVVLGAAAGAALVALRPWRHPGTRRVARGGMRQARRWLVRQMSNPLLHTAIATAISSLAAMAPPRASAAARPDAPASPTPNSPHAKTDAAEAAASMH